MRSLTVVLAVVVIAVSCSTPTPTDPNGEWRPTTAWEKTLARIRPDGSMDLDTALVAFSLAIAPLPGVALPPEDPGLITDGTEAVRWLRSHWNELTDAQQTEAQRHLVPTGRPGAVEEPVPGPSTRLLAGLATGALGQRIAIDAITAPSPSGGRDVGAARDAVEAAITAHLKRTITIVVQPLDLLGRPMWSAMGDAWRAAAKAVGAQRSEAFIDVLDGDAEDVTRAWPPLHARESSWNDPWIYGRSDIVFVVHADDETARWPFSMHCHSGTERGRSWACRT